jgi:sialate O-acetylesterase
MPRRNWEQIILVLACVLCFSTIVKSDIVLPKLFSDHMVLQRNSKVPIWGTAEPAQQLIVTFDKTKTTVVADAQGVWSTSIATPDAGGPFNLEIAAVDADPKVVFTDVMVGEVWICAGQENMECPMTDVLNPETEIDNSKRYDNLRLFSVDHSSSPQPLDDFTNVTPWSRCSPETVKTFSAAAYFFGREVSKELNANRPKDARIAIGLINVTWDSTPCEAWISRPTLDRVSALAPLMRYWSENDDPISQSRPGNLFNGMISPLKNLKFRGAIFHQGEANVGRGHQYATLLPTLIGDWREFFSSGEFPFYFVQLSPYRYESLATNALPEVWDAQLKTLQTIGNTGMVVTTDIGNVAQRNPKNKQAVGRRLALLSLAKTYNNFLPLESREISSSGPVYQKMSTNGDRIRIIFDHGEGLRTRDGNELSDFLICGEDQEFVPATAIITEDGAVEVSSPDVSSPIAVRFGWTDTAEPNLENSAGFPASPFRTDNFDLESLEENF